ncbi:MAG: Aminotransferase class-III [Candidatus Levybacteria bacterium GW2011_GWC2_40_7]|nr:MAG: Aminotransferase class-III [Candidatus Levybacteria bacterium GW2011_GWC2_40_7]
MLKNVRIKKGSKYLSQGDFVYRHKFVPVFVKAYGSILEDYKGNKYLDAEAANGTANLGFNSDILQSAFKKVENIPSIPSFCETDLRIEIATRVGKKMKTITGENGKVAFELGGAQGVELGLKVVKSNTKKAQFVVFQGGYHGRSIYTSQFSASHRYRSLIGDWRIPLIRLPYPDYEQSTSKENMESWKKHTLYYIKQLAELEAGGMVTRGVNQDIVALIIEPLLNAGGIIKPDADFMEEVVRIFRNLGALIVVDEIFCGFYRTGKMFGFQHYNFTPDIVIMSKALTNGITPLSCVWARDPYLLPKNFPPGTHSATYVNNPLAMATASSVLDRYDQWKDIDKDLSGLEKSLQRIINKIVASSSLAKSGYALGGVGRILLKDNIAGEILEIARTIAWDRPVDGVSGLILASTGMAPNVVALNPPLNISSKDLVILEKLLQMAFEKTEKKTS